MFKYTKTLFFDENSSHGKIFKHINRDERILEFGCGNGQLAKKMKEELGARVCAVEISEIAMQEAKEYLELGIVADAESLEWVKKLGNRKFDAIICADILEHLRNPEKVLQAALPFLEDDGRVIFSVPNIAHGDIIIKLLENRFDYTSLGLLDDTHLHFFAKENLETFCESAELILAEVETTMVPLGESEQKKPNVNKDVLSFVRTKKYADTYQFVCVAYKKTYAQNCAIKLSDTPSTALTGKIYFNTGKDFSEDNALFVTSNEKGVFDFEISIPDNIVSVRFDPTEWSGYILSDTEIFADSEKIIPDAIINAQKYKNDYLITDNDPQLIFKIPTSKKFSFKGRCLPLYSYSNGAENLYKFISNFGRYIMDIINETDRAIEATSETVKEQEELIHDLSKENDNLKEQINNLRAEIKEKYKQVEKDQATIYSQEVELYRANTEIAKYKECCLATTNHNNNLQARIMQLEGMYSCISRSACWRMTKPLRVLLDIIKWPFRKIKIFRLIRKGIRCLRENGFKYTWKKFKNKLKNKKRYASAQNPLYTKEELEAQKNKKFSKDVKFSILVPLYNTPEKFLVEMIQSVVAQTYSNWELCLADGSDTKHKEVEQICKKFAKNDARILYKKLEKNLGISGNTNACIDMATGNYISLFDHDDLLHPAALYEVMTAICDKNADFIYTDENTFHSTPADAYCPHFKPDFSPDTLRSYNYICHFTSFKASLIDEVGKFRSEFDGSQDYDMILRLTEKAKNIVHIPKILYYWRSHANSVASDISAKPYTLVAAKKALDEHLSRVGIKGKATDARIPSTYKIEYEIDGNPLVSIIIPNKDHIDDLKKCIDTIESISTYKNYELIVVENNSEEERTFDYYKILESTYENVKIVKWQEEGFNYSKINNFGFKFANGEYVILLNNDIEPLTPSWIEEMLMFAQRKDVGAVGTMLYYPDDTIQHAGVIIGIGGGDPDMAVAGHSHKYYRRGDYGYASRLAIAQNLSAVTAACLMVRADVYQEVGGLDESFAVAFNDVDFCLRIRAAGYLIVWTPFAEAYHYESKSRGLETTPEKVARFNSEINNFLAKWKDVRDAGDPYYNPNLTLEHENFDIK